MRCKFIKSDGTECKGFTIAGSEYCWRHSPEINEYSKKHASSKGGKNKLKLIPLGLPEIIINDSRDVPPLLVDTIQHLRNAEIDIRLGTAIGYLSNVLLKAYEVADLEVRIIKMEKYMEENFKEA